MRPSAALVSGRDGQVIENLDIRAAAGVPPSTAHHGVVVRNCRIAHSQAVGIWAYRRKGVVLQAVKIINVGAPSPGENRGWIATTSSSPIADACASNR